MTGHRQTRWSLSPVPGTGDRWRIEPVGAMTVPGIVFASPALLPDVRDNEALRQVVNVASLPGIVRASYAMPDVHWGYGFPIGGVAATDVDAGGVVSPGGVGFDISCGVRLLASPLSARDLVGRREPVMDRLDEGVPRGLGPGGLWEPDRAEFESVLRRGMAAAVAAGRATEADVARCEDGGSPAQGDPSGVGDRALARGRQQLGSLGGGNHFLEVQVVEAVYDTEAAAAFGLAATQVCVMIHCGSRGLGHQVCSDQIQHMARAMHRYGIRVPDPQLACVPVHSAEGQTYLAAMAAAANYGRVNRQLLTEAVRAAFLAATGCADLRIIYDVSHNLATLEHHPVGGRTRLLCVHRKGATRALPPGDPRLPDDLRPWGQPVLVPGSMGSASYVLAGVDPGDAFSSACHGAGRRLSRHAAVRLVRGEVVRHDLEAAGITVRARSPRALAEEAPVAYKDVDEVVATCGRAGLARPVVRLRPVGVVKG